MIVALAILAGALGAGLRYILDFWLTHRLPGAMPWGIFLVNVTGALFLGILMGAGAGETVLFVVGGGFLGAYTTFSTWMFQAVTLAQQGRMSTAAFHVLGSLVVGVAATAVGMGLGVLWS